MKLVDMILANSIASFVFLLNFENNWHCVYFQHKILITKIPFSIKACKYFISLDISLSFKKVFFFPPNYFCAQEVHFV